jgi:hypothetical protein
MLAIPRAVSQDRQSCWIVRTSAASFLRRCTDRIYSFSLVLDEIRRMPGGDDQGRFGFACPLELMCAGEPDIIGWFIDPAIWQQSEQDENAVFDVLQSAGPGLHERGPVPPRPQPACPVFEAQVSDMRGRGVCYDFPETQSSWVVFVTADDNVGFALIFQQHKLDASALREMALRTLARSKVERGSGDVGLMRWIR